MFGVGLGGPDHVCDFLQVEPDDVRLIYEAAESKMGSVDVVINNAGITRINFIEDQDPETDWGDVIQVNLHVPYLFAREMVSRIATSRETLHKDFKIINVASMAARYALRASTAYNASKAGLVAMTRSMAKECAGRLPVSHYAVSPNGIAGTAMIEQAISELCRTRGWSREQAEEYNCQAPMGRLCSQKEVAEVIRYCVEDAPQYMTGHNFELLGGMPA